MAGEVELACLVQVIVMMMMMTMMKNLGRTPTRRFTLDLAAASAFKTMNIKAGVEALGIP